ncbi:polysaccharide lyase [Akkermansiaceae bacterium]|nr:polysaccharide lyase [Akkermansiaceae bacterium]
MSQQVQGEELTRNIGALLYETSFEERSFVERRFKNLAPDRTRSHRDKSYTALAFSVDDRHGIDPGDRKNEDHAEGFTFQGLKLLSLTESFARSGKSAMRSHVPRTAEHPTAYRSEVMETRYQEILPDSGLERWLGVSIYIPDDWVFTNTAAILAQWHAGPADGSKRARPPIELNIIDEFWALSHTWDHSIHDSKKSSKEQADANRRIVSQLAKVRRGTWNDIVFHLKWDYRSDGKGFLKVWLNDKNVYRYDGPLGYNEPNAPYFKMGIYRPGWQDPDWQDKRRKYDQNGKVLSEIQVKPAPLGITVFHDDLRIGNEMACYVDVVPGLPRKVPKRDKSEKYSVPKR